jgi:hypothetical protein
MRHVIQTTYGGTYRWKHVHVRIMQEKQHWYVALHMYERNDAAFLQQVTYTVWFHSKLTPVRATIKPTSHSMLTCSYKSVYVCSNLFWMYSGFPVACDRRMSCFRWLQLQQTQRSFPVPCFPLTYCAPKQDTCSDERNRGISEHKLHVSINQQPTAHCLHYEPVLLTLTRLPYICSSKRKICSVTCFIFYISLAKIILGITVCEVQ